MSNVNILNLIEFLNKFNLELLQIKDQLQDLACLYKQTINPWPVDVLPETLKSKYTKHQELPVLKDDNLNEEPTDELKLVEKMLTKARIVHANAAQKEQNNVTKSNSTKNPALKKSNIEKQKDMKTNQNKKDFGNSKAAIKPKLPVNKPIFQDRKAIPVTELVDELEPVKNIPKLCLLHSKHFSEIIHKNANKNPCTERLMFAQNLERKNESRSVVNNITFTETVTKYLIICINCIRVLESGQHSTFSNKKTNKIQTYYHYRMVRCIKEIYNELLELIAELVNCKISEVTESKKQTSTYNFKSVGCLPLLINDKENALQIQSYPANDLCYQSKTEMLAWNANAHDCQSQFIDIKLKSVIYEAFKTEYAKNKTTLTQSESIKFFQNIYGVLCNDSLLPAAIKST